MTRPTVAEVRAVGQPPGLLDRNSGEHWAGRLYLRRLSPHLTRLLIPTPATPDAVTLGMIVCGFLAAGALSMPGLGWAAAAVLAIQLQILLDCSDGELARWRRSRQDAPARAVGGAAGIWLDRLGHFLTGAVLPVGLGVRADGGWDELGGHTTLGVVVGLLTILLWSQSALVTVARVEAGLPPAGDSAAVAAPRASGLARVRRLLSFAPVFRAFVAMEFTLLCLVAASVDAVTGSLDGSRALVLGLVPLAALVVAGRAVAILSSSRLR